MQGAGVLKSKKWQNYMWEKMKQYIIYFTIKKGLKGGS